MRPSFRTSLFLPPLALAVAALYPLTRASLAPPDPEALTGPWLLLALDHGVEEEVREAIQRTEAKCQVIDALIEGRLTLPQAAARFQDLNAGTPEKARPWRPPWCTEEEWPYRQVIVFVSVEFEAKRGAPAQAKEWVARLEAELREHLRHDSAPACTGAVSRREGPTAEPSPPSPALTGPASPRRSLCPPAAPGKAA